MSEMFTALCCTGCGRGYGTAADRDQWHSTVQRGLQSSVTCPDCRAAGPLIEGVVSGAIRSPPGPAAPGANAARITGTGEWYLVESGIDPIVRNDPATHLAIRIVDSVLRLAVAPHSDAALVSIFAPGTCAEIATAALADEGAKATGRRVIVQASPDLPPEVVILAADHASLQDGEDRGELVLLFHPDISPGLLRAFAPHITDRMRRQRAASAHGDWSAGLLARLVSDDVVPWITASWMSSLLARPGALPPGTDLAQLDRRVLRSLQASNTTPADLVVTACSSYGLSKAVSFAWKVLAADLGIAWTALEVAAWACGMQVARRSACAGPGVEVCQLALRGQGRSVLGPVGVAGSAGEALHRAALTLLETLAESEPTSEVLAPESWAGVRGLVAWVDETRIDSVVSALVAQTQLTPPAEGKSGGKRRQAKGWHGEGASSTDAARFAEDFAAELVHQQRLLEVGRQAQGDTERWIEQWRERIGKLAEDVERTEAEILAAGAEWDAAALRGIDFPDRQDFQWAELQQRVRAGGAELNGTAHRVGEADGQALWVGRIRPETGGAGELLVEGPVQLSQDAALNAAAVCAAVELGVEVGEVADLLRVWHLVPPPRSLPLVAELARAGVLRGWETAIEGEGPFTVTMSADAHGGPVRVRASGDTEEDGVESCARALLAVLSGERGFGPLEWTAQAAERWLRDAGAEPWLGGCKRRTTRPTGGGRQVRLRARVDGYDVWASTVAEVEPIAELATRWLLVQKFTRLAPPAALELEAARARHAADALREAGVLGEVEFADRPDGGNAVVARAAFAGGQLWAAGPDRDRACADLLAAVRCRLLAPGTADRSGVGAPAPGWAALFEVDPDDDGDELEAGERLLAAVRSGARLCVVGVDGPEPGFVAVDQATARKAKPGRDSEGFRVWSERGALLVPGPPVPVVDAARHLLAADPEPGWDASAAAWREILRYGCQVVAAGHVRPGIRTDGTALWRPGPLDDQQQALLEQLAAGLPPWGHSAALPGRRETMLSAHAAAHLVLAELTNALARGPGVAAIWGHNPLTARTGQPVRADAAQWLDALEELADPTPPPGVVIQVMPPPRATAPAHTLQVTIRLRPAEHGTTLVTLPDLTERHGPQHPAVLRARRALRKAAALWPPLAGADDGDRVRVRPGEAALLLGHLGRVLRHAGVQVVWPEQWAARLRATVVASGPPGAGLALDQLVDYRWQLRLDGTPLSTEESERIAAAAGALLWLRNRWVLVDEITAERARGRRLRRGVPAGEALQAVLLGSVELEDGEHADVVADGGLADLAGLLTGASHTPVEPPPGLAGTLWPYQRTGFAWLAGVTSNFGAVLADEMGLGKTIQAIALILHRIHSGQSKGLPVLVVAPASMVLTWVRRLAEFAPTVPVRGYHGPHRSLEHLAADEVVVTSYSTLVEDRALLAGQAYSAVVADEAQFIKNASSQRSQALTAVPALTRLALTGTPVENRLKDLAALLNWANPHLFAQAAFMRAFGSLEKNPDPQTQRALNRVVGTVMLRRRKGDPEVALDLPEKITSRHVLALTPTQVGLYTRATRIATEVIRTAAGRERSAAVLRLITQLRQISNSPLHLRIGSATSDRLATGLAGYDPARASKEACKFAALDDLVPTVLDSDPESAVVIFTEFATMAMVLQRHAAAWGCRPLLYLGSMTSGQRDAVLAKFSGRRSRLLIATYGSGGTGLDLTTANHAVLADTQFNPARVNQAVDRLHRPGQKHTVHVHHLQAAGTIEEKIERLLARKSGLLDALSPVSAFDPTLLSNDELFELIALGAAA